MKTGIELIKEERARQKSKEGWTAEHDATQRQGELSCAGSCYAMAASAQVRFSKTTMRDIEPPAQWPWDAPAWKLSDDPIRTLTKAGALIAAEIDRLQLATVCDYYATLPGSNTVTNRRCMLPKGHTGTHAFSR
jgi:hypothetical protein